MKIKVSRLISKFVQLKFHSNGHHYPIGEFVVTCDNNVSRSISMKHLPCLPRKRQTAVQSFVG